MLKIENLTKYYGKVRGVENLNLEVKKGEVFGFIGPNGAGKSTTIKCIMNEINKSSGKIYVEDVLINEKNYSIKKDIGYLPGEVHLYDDLTVKAMLLYSSKFYDEKSLKKAFSLAKRLDLDINKKIEDLSLGNLKKVGVVLCLMHDPKLIILDEPTSGLDPLIQEELFKILMEEKNKGKTIFFSSHVLSEIKKTCDRVGIIRDGNLIKIEKIADIQEKHFINVQIESNELESIEKELNIHVINNKFRYSEDINKLISVLNKYKISKLYIEEPSLEDIFMHYYKEGK